MTDRADIERVLSEGYAARVRGDVHGILKAFCEDGRFQTAGAGAIAMTATGHGELGPAMGQLCKAFDLLNHAILTMLIDGDAAAVHWRGRFRSTATGETADTELVHIVKFRDGRIVSMTEFCDTALAARMLGA